jgi:uncharacterized protein YebE (UPF0316 family)
MREVRKMKAEFLTIVNMIQDYVTLGLVIFIIVNLINVMLSTMKSILTVKSTRLVATLINAVSYGFYALIVKQMADYDITTVVVVTIVANLIGVYSSMWILDKFKKDKLWKITIVTSKLSADLIALALARNEIGFNQYDIKTKYGDSVALDIFSESQETSVIIKRIIGDYSVKYHVIEVGKGL